MKIKNFKIDLTKQQQREYDKFFTSQLSDYGNIVISIERIERNDNFKDAIFISKMMPETEKERKKLYNLAKSLHNIILKGNKVKL